MCCVKRRVPCEKKIAVCLWSPAKMPAEGNPYRKQPNKYRPQTTLILADCCAAPTPARDELRYNGIASVSSLAMAEAQRQSIVDKEDKEAERRRIATIIKWSPDFPKNTRVRHVMNPLCSCFCTWLRTAREKEQELHRLLTQRTANMTAETLQQHMAEYGDAEEETTHRLRTSRAATAASSHGIKTARNNIKTRGSGSCLFVFGVSLFLLYVYLCVCAHTCVYDLFACMI